MVIKLLIIFSTYLHAWGFSTVSNTRQEVYESSLSLVLHRPVPPHRKVNKIGTTLKSRKRISDESNDMEDDSCISGSNFFDNNLHVEDGSMLFRAVC